MISLGRQPQESGQEKWSKPRSGGRSVAPPGLISFFNVSVWDG